MANSIVSPLDTPSNPLQHNKRLPESVELLDITSLNSATGETPSSTRASKINSGLTDGWVYEILSCVVAILALASLVAILRYFDGFIITELPLHISINTLIAVIGAVIKAMILLPVAESISELKWSWFITRKQKLVDFENFDIASRGPWGAALLIFHLRGRHLATIGAWLTLLVLAVDPFTQQAVRPVRCDHGLSGGAARLPYANNITKISAHVGPGLPQQLLPDLASAMYTGLLGDSRSLNSECSTGNCTFPGDAAVGSFQTIALDASCVDISNEIVEVKSKNAVRGPWYLPSLGNATSAVGQSLLVHTYATTESSPFLKYWNKENDTALFSFAALLFQPNEGCTDASTCTHALAVECRLNPTIQTMYTTIELSKVQEEVVNIQSVELVPYPSVAPKRSHLDSWMSIPEEVIRNGERESCTPSMTYTPDTPVAISNNSFWSASGNPTPSDLRWWADWCVFWIPSGSSWALSAFLEGIYDDKTMMGAYGPSIVQSTYGDVWIKNLYENGTATVDTVQTRFRQLANTMNTYFRNRNSTDDGRTTYTTGTAVQTDTCIKVQWAWITYSASLVALTIMFLCLTIWKTKRTNRSGPPRGTWKSSALAVLFSGLQEDLRKEHGELDKQTRMAHRAGELEVRLEPTESGWRLKRRMSS
ncbi:hypothetical protein C7974DRAFT_399064 [Boeremia exigua]|uniref:uncharacterized protein n=1 Tax=Boeremia exigua TaxID=749465 RepID=UPI001E8DDE8F|nr:uncharacterized protein C7974DRAFT_399064 [Boeremia exigua]KAH6620179.1 hypothetical protein C7974DRAFT_399064 [Boeremia exigua]